MARVSFNEDLHSPAPDPEQEILNNIISNPGAYRRTLTPAQKRRFDLAIAELHLSQEDREAADLLARKPSVASVITTASLPTPIVNNHRLEPSAVAVQPSRNAGVAGITTNDGEGPDGFTVYEQRAKNSNRTFGENEEPELTEEELVDDAKEDSDE
jgi:hypothetical protein